MDNNDNQIHIKRVDWPEERERIMAIREAVFIVEQRVSMDIELDGLDEQCQFVLAEDQDGNAVGTCRLSPNGKIGRLAVLKPYRGRGVGSALLRAIISIALQQGICDLYLHGQSYAMDFYIKHGFVPEGPEFIEADIPHIKLRFNP
jgi:predicted GNAT family N-acyltransferase